MATLPAASPGFTPLTSGPSQLPHPSSNTANYGYPGNWAELYSSLYPVSPMSAATLTPANALNYDSFHPHQQHWMDQMKKRKEKQDKIRREIQCYMILMVPYFMWSHKVWGYFAATELMDQYLTKLGVGDAETLFIMLLMQTLDVRAFIRGRLKLMPGALSSVLMELYDEIMEVNKVPDMLRLGSQMMMPQSGPPQYQTVKISLPAT